jgi:hypothetical protein
LVYKITTVLEKCKINYHKSGRPKSDLTHSL